MSIRPEAAISPPLTVSFAASVIARLAVAEMGSPASVAVAPCSTQAPVPLKTALRPVAPPVRVPPLAAPNVRVCVALGTAGGFQLPARPRFVLLAPVQTAVEGVTAEATAVMAPVEDRVRNVPSPGPTAAGLVCPVPLTVKAPPNRFPAASNFCPEMLLSPASWVTINPLLSKTVDRWPVTTNT